MLRRAGPRGFDQDVVTAGDARVERGREVTLRGEPVQLTFSEFELLNRLMGDPGRLFNRQELLRAIWGDSANRDPRAIDVHVRHLREKLEERPEVPTLILTVRGAGYRLKGPRHAQAAPPGLRVRLVLALLLTSAVTLAVAALTLLPPLRAAAARPRRCTRCCPPPRARAAFQDADVPPGREAATLAPQIRSLERRANARVVLFDAKLRAVVDTRPSDRRGSARHAGRT